MDRIEAMKVFVAALDEGSLAGAGRLLGRSPAAVSRAIAFLEQHVGAELLHRTTRTLKLSEAGEGRTRLVFTHRGMERKWVGLTFPGWRQLLERLNALMTTGETAPDLEGRWRQLQDAYFAHYRFEGVLRDPPLPMEKYKD